MTSLISRAHVHGTRSEEHYRSKRVKVLLEFIFHLTHSNDTTQLWSRATEFAFRFRTASTALKLLSTALRYFGKGEIFDSKLSLCVSTTDLEAIVVGMATGIGVAIGCVSTTDLEEIVVDVATGIGVRRKL